MLVAGNTTTNGSSSAMSQFTVGASVAAAKGDGLCGGSTPIRFGNDMKSQCVVELTTSELQTYCTNTPAHLALNWTSVGIFGKAKTEYTGNWTTVTAGNSVPTATWDATTSKCSGLVTGITVEGLYGYYGKTAAPQAGVASVYVYYVSGDWTSPTTSSANYTHTVLV